MIHDDQIFQKFGFGYKIQTDRAALYGTYACTASNPHETSHHSSQLTVPVTYQEVVVARAVDATMTP